MSRPNATPPADRYTTLDAPKIIDTVQRLARRIEERFPQRGLHGVSLQLLALAQAADRHARFLARPIWWVWLINGLLWLLMVGLVASFVWTLVGGRMASEARTFAPLVVVEEGVAAEDGRVLVQPNTSTASDSAPSLVVGGGEYTFFDLLEAIEAGINDLIFLGVLLFFLARWETRIKRRRALNALHALRAIAHVIDMHQLTKDPERVQGKPQILTPTPSSPPNELTPELLGRYLDYCSEMLSLTGKLAALHVQGFNDDIVLNSVNEIESLTTGLSSKIWQKLMILHVAYPDAFVDSGARDADDEALAAISLMVGLE